MPVLPSPQNAFQCGIATRDKCTANFWPHSTNAIKLAHWYQFKTFSLFIFLFAEKNKKIKTQEYWRNKRQADSWKKISVDNQNIKMVVQVVSNYVFIHSLY